MTSTEAREAGISSVALKILAGTSVLCLLYVGRGVLVPITLAAMLGFMMAPLVKKLRGLGLAQAPAAVLTLIVAGLATASVATAILLQVGTMADSMPRYEAHVRAKIATLREVTLGRLAEAQGHADRLIGDLAPPREPTHGSEAGSADSPLALLMRFVSSLWAPLGTAGVVLLVLIFVLLEQDSLRDRLIRLTGGQDVRAATNAFNDAGQRLSRYFASQFSVNLGVAVVIGLLLAAVGVPQAAVWATLAGLLRFIPYVGFPAAAVCAGTFAAAVVPGWELMGATLVVFLVVELVVAHVVEPKLYGHATGLSPFSVVVSAIFWGALWGPVGLLLSTPLTLCLVVAGRHVQALAFLDILFGDTPALTMSQRFYQRCISGDSVELVADARAFLKRKSLAAYCDKIVIPAFEMATADQAQGLISNEQRRLGEQVVVRIFSELAHEPRRTRVARGALLDAPSLGIALRQGRVQTEGRWQGRLDVPAGSVSLCISMAGEQSQLIAELLVRVMRAEGLDARHVTIAELADPPAEARADIVGTVFVVGTDAHHPASRDNQVLDETLAALSQANVVMLLPALQRQEQGDPITTNLMHRTAYSFEEALALVSGARH
ncbi:AI-2E family transporter [Roseateles cellulosilyticus]|uniref:AI-2E family transporter n=1 Tax=Pelomonas cellulosilytica TaxID=2906762 RepID=A0ABS8Y3W3_9BURK|nr:AI-2E family transporter [Pelomonas sp. P8]MCE4557926.1 AI-2E family transporter [Pelomonas sp. P8]